MTIPMQRLLLVMLAACGGASVRHGAPLPPELVQPNAGTFSEPRPLEDWLPPDQVESRRAWPTHPYRIVRADTGRWHHHWHDEGIITAPIGSEPYAGIECQTWQPGRAELADSDVVGAFVARVAAGSPAEAAGLHGGELVLAWHGTTGTASGGCIELNAFLHAQLASDPHVALAIWQPAMGAPLARTIAVPAAFGPLGITVDTLEHSDVQAPFVLATDQRAEHLGFAPGDLIVAVDGTSVRWKRELHDALASAGFPAQSRPTTIEVARFGAGRWVPMIITSLPADRYQEPM